MAITTALAVGSFALSALGAIQGRNASKDAARARSDALEAQARIDALNAEAFEEQAELAASIEEENAILIEQDADLKFLLLLQDADLARFAGLNAAEDMALVTRVEYADSVNDLAGGGISIESASSINFMQEQLFIAQKNINTITFNAEIQATARENEADRVLFAGDVAAKGARDNARQERLKGEIAKRGALAAAANNSRASGAALTSGNAMANAQFTSNIGNSLLTFASSKGGQEAMGVT